MRMPFTGCKCCNRCLKMKVTRLFCQRHVNVASPSETRKFILYANQESSITACICNTLNQQPNKCNCFKQILREELRTTIKDKFQSTESLFNKQYNFEGRTTLPPTLGLRCRNKTAIFSGGLEWESLILPLQLGGTLILNFIITLTWISTFIQFHFISTPVMLKFHPYLFRLSENSARTHSSIKFKEIKIFLQNRLFVRGEKWLSVRETISKGEMENFLSVGEFPPSFHQGKSSSN